MKKIYILGVLTMFSSLLMAQNKNGTYNDAKRISVSSNSKYQNNIETTQLQNFDEVVQKMGGCGSVTALNCGDDATGLTTIGEGNGLDSASCASTALGNFDLSGGEDYYFSVTATPTTTSQITICFDNVLDDDPYFELIFLGTSCSSGYVTSCNNAQWTLPNSGMGGGFSGGTSSCANFSVSGAGTYYFVIDSQGDGVTSFDIADPAGGSGIQCNTSSFSLDGTCTANDSDGDGIATSVNGSYTTSQETLVPGNSYTICTDVYLANTGFEWLDYYDLSLGECWTNISNITPNGTDNEFYASCYGSGIFTTCGGDWAGTYNAAAQEINWSFTHNSNSSWGDGSGAWPASGYSCAQYTFCFDGTIDPLCTNPYGGTISVTCTDDGVGNNSTTLVGSASSTEDTTEIIVSPPLLVDYLYINGSSRGEMNVLEWHVDGSKEDVEMYTVMKSIDAQDYEPLAQIEPKGDAYDLNKYIFGDKHPYKNTYYKVKQKDKNGRYSFSKVIHVENNNVKEHNIVARYNLVGVEVDEHYKGVYLEVYSNGDVKKVINR